MNDSDYGGGTPVVDVWRRDVGLAIGHVELAAEARLAAGRARRSAATRRSRSRMKRERDARARAVAWRRCAASSPSIAATISTRCAPTARRCRRRASACRRRRRTPSTRSGAPGATAATFTPAQVFETLPVVKQLGFGWAVLDDGWQVALGDWRPRTRQVPGRRRRHEGARGSHPRGRAQGAALVGADGRRSRFAHRARAPGLAAAQRRRLDAQDHLVGFAVPVPRRRRRARGRRGVRAARRSANGDSTGSRSTAST